MARAARRTIGTAGATVPPGRAARRTALLFAAGSMLAAVFWLASWYQERDLRDLDGLNRTTATVLEHDSKRRGADLLTVQFAAGRGEQVTIPYGGSAREGDDVAVGYVPAAPDRARTVDDWYPEYQTWLTWVLLLGVVAVGLGVFGLLSRRRGGRWETHDPVGTAPQEALGRRLVRGSLFLESAFTGIGLGCVAVAVGVAVTRPADRTPLLLAGAGLLALCLAGAALLHWAHGRDGVWATDDELVARRRSTVRRWPWDQVLELGMVVDGGRATIAAARVDDGVDDGIADDGWVTLAEPSAGPLAAHQWAIRFRGLADERGLPFTEGLNGIELADALGSTYVRRRPRPGSGRERPGRD